MTEEQKTNSTTTKGLLVNDPIQIRFLTNSKFCSKLKQYLTKTYNVKCEIAEDHEQDEELVLRLTFISDAKQNVKNAREFLKTTFASIQTKIYDNIKKDGKGMTFVFDYIFSIINSNISLFSVIDWSTHIYSECILQTIQKIMNNRKIYTIWDKTEMFLGYYIVHYFQDNIQHFGAASKDIDLILRDEISYVEIIDNIPIVKTKMFLQELDKIVRDTQKEQQELTILYYKQPFMKICLYGNKHVVKSVQKQIQKFMRKHNLKAFYIEMDETQVGNNDLSN